jgi:hypothetical protein
MFTAPASGSLMRILPTPVRRRWGGFGGAFVTDATGWDGTVGKGLLGSTIERDRLP